MEKKDFIEKLQGRELVNSHAIGNKVNEIIDTLNAAILEEKSQEEQEKKDGNISS